MVGRCGTNSHKAAGRHIHPINGQGSDFYGFYPTSKTQRQFPVMSADQSAAESGVEYPSMGSAGFAFLAWYFHMVVCRWFEFMDPGDPCPNVADGMGH